MGGAAPQMPNGEMPEMGGAAPQMPNGEMPEMGGVAPQINNNIHQKQEDSITANVAEIISENKSQNNKPAPTDNDAGKSLVMTGVSMAALVVAIVGVSLVKNKF